MLFKIWQDTTIFLVLLNLAHCIDLRIINQSKNVNEHRPIRVCKNTTCFYNTFQIITLRHVIITFFQATVMGKKGRHNAVKSLPKNYMLSSTKVSLLLRYLLYLVLHFINYLDVFIYQYNSLLHFKCTIFYYFNKYELYFIKIYINSDFSNLQPFTCKIYQRISRQY